MKLDIDALDESMKNHCHDQAWDLRIEMAKHDDSLCQQLISDVLMCLTGELAATDGKSSVIAEPNFTDAKARFQRKIVGRVESWSAVRCGNE
jgi:hypothetical protein